VLLSERSQPVRNACMSRSRTLMRGSVGSITIFVSFFRGFIPVGQYTAYACASQRFICEFFVGMTIAIFKNSACQNGIFAICSLRMLLGH